MAFSQGKQSVAASAQSFKKFKGVASLKVLAVNPNKDQWNKILGANREEEIDYVSVKDDVKTVRITFLCEIDSTRSVDKSGGIIPITFFLRKAQIKGSQSGKIKIIDKYGRTAWATQDDIDAKRIPQYSNGPASIDVDYRKCISGEEELTLFLKTLMCIPDIQFYNRTLGKFETNKNPQDCEARLDKIMKYFDGDVAEIRSILKTFPNNQVRVLLGVRNSDGKEYQDFFNQWFVQNGNPSNLSFAKRLLEARGLNRYQNTDFGEATVDNSIVLHDVSEYVVAPTEYQDNNASMPQTNDALPTVTDNVGSTIDEDDLPF